MIHSFFSRRLSPRRARVATFCTYAVMIVAIYLTLDAPEARFLYGRL